MILFLLVLITMLRAITELKTLSSRSERSWLPEWLFTDNPISIRILGGRIDLWILDPQKWCSWGQFLLSLWLGKILYIEALISAGSFWWSIAGSALFAFLFFEAWHEVVFIRRRERRGFLWYQR